MSGHPDEDDPFPEGEAPPPKPRAKVLFPADEMSTGHGSAHARRAANVLGTPAREPLAVTPLERTSTAEQQAFRAKALADAATAAGAKAPPRKPKSPAADGAADTFVKRKMKQAEDRLPTFDFDDFDGG